ncbi:MAG: hypothetical protein L6Q97_08650 [Thermoanaerobaculia bacterium]|nr:hypothetical protein [Thermoanaerobaculia bacterium]
MHWRFDPLFSLTVFHTRYTSPDPDTGESPRRAPDFTFEPTRATAARLLRLGWVFKAQTGSFAVYGEKVFESNGTAVLRGWPALGEGFTFLLRLNNAALLNETKPYVLDSDPVVVPNPNLPEYSGRSRILYFDNRNPTALPGGELRLTPGTVDEQQLGSKAPSAFDFVNLKPGATALQITPLSPGAVSHTIPVPPGAKSVKIDLPENGYTFGQNVAGFSETIFLSPESLTGNVLGVVRIFEPAGGAWDDPPRRYQIIFEKV